ncbi:MAG: Maf family protein [Synergistaceae bacterium]|jgi:septum formation protein|nr:Maf family protein [Synergistaceae bacterium]
MKDISGLKIDVVLASGSPRRRELLQGLGWNFRVVVPEVDESVLPRESPEELCLRLSVAKAGAAMELRGGKIHVDGEVLVIAADTVVVVDGSILGKPADEADSLRMLRLLRGRSHEVLTGVSVINSNIEERRLSALERTVVTFRPLSDADVAAYAATGEGTDKAGAYAIQGRGSLLASSIEGDYFNVVGLPLCRLGTMIEELGINLGRQWAGQDKSDGWR